MWLGLTGSKLTGQMVYHLTEDKESSLKLIVLFECASCASCVDLKRFIRKCIVRCYIARSTMHLAM